MIHLDSGIVLDAYMGGDWYVDHKKRLYVIPLRDHEPWGPDNVLMNLLSHGTILSGLTPIPVILRRWSPHRGFYHA